MDNVCPIVLQTVSMIRIQELVSIAPATVFHAPLKINALSAFGECSLSMDNVLLVGTTVWSAIKRLVYAISVQTDLLSSKDNVSSAVLWGCSHITTCLFRETFVFNVTLLAMDVLIPLKIAFHVPTTPFF